MKKQRIGIILAMATTVGLAQADQALMDLLEQVSPPQQEYIRIPASYVLTALEKSARSSGTSELISFSIKNELEGSENTELSIDFTGMNMLKAIQTVAEAMGGGADFQEKGVVIMDENLVPKNHPEPEEPTSTKSSKRDKDPLFSFSDISHALVFVESGDGRGSGFIAKMDDTVYFISNQHNLFGAESLELNTMDGKTLKPKEFEYHKNLDLIRMKLSEDSLEDLTVLTLSEKTPSTDDRIFVYGNSAGGDVATELDGEIIGVGPTSIEVNAKFVPGNSGSPILNREGEVIGVASYATSGPEFEKGSPYEKLFKGTRFSKVRRYGIRIPEEGWVKGNLPSFLSQTYQLMDMQSYLMASYTLFTYALGDKKSVAPAQSIIAYYEKPTNTGKPVIDFKLEEMEKLFRQLVRSFKHVITEITNSSKPLIAQISSSSQDRGFTTRSKTETEVDAERISRIVSRFFSDKILAVKTQAEQTTWQSALLEEQAEAVIEIADEFILQIESLK
ncbi:MAG: trypsin-like peptidase domain-containing protein [Lentisphaerae bacterium]|jgi:S1-C subfamily serine protease|nr:trypsin-like peptidase domain-containing protein [Lentisphaerota bacterium]